MSDMSYSRKMSLGALVCGILGIIGSWFPIIKYFTFLFAIAGIVLGVKARKIADPEDRSFATAGLVCGIVGTVFGAIGVACAVCIGSLALFGFALEMQDAAALAGVLFFL